MKRTPPDNPELYGVASILAKYGPSPFMMASTISVYAFLIEDPIVHPKHPKFLSYSLTNSHARIYRDSSCLQGRRPLGKGGYHPRGLTRPKTMHTGTGSEQPHVLSPANLYFLTCKHIQLPFTGRFRRARYGRIAHAWPVRAMIARTRSVKLIAIHLIKIIIYDGHFILAAGSTPPGPSVIMDFCPHASNRSDCATLDVSSSSFCGISFGHFF